MSLNGAEGIAGTDKAVLYRTPSQFGARKWKSNDYPRFEAWCSNDTWLCNSTAFLTPYSVPSGQHAATLSFAQRAYGTGAAPARSTTNKLFLGWPYEKLAGTTLTDATGDTLIGPDFYHLPYRLHAAIAEWASVHTRRLTDEGLMEGYIRCLAYKHTFTFYNYNRHTMRLYYRVNENWGGTSNLFESIMTSGAPVELHRYNVAHVDIPGVLDSGDQPKRMQLVLKRNMAGMYPEIYKVDPDDGHTVVSPQTQSWVPMSPLTHQNTSITNQIVLTPLQLKTVEPDDTLTTGFEDPASKLAHNVQFAARLLTGLNVGVTDATVGTGGSVATNGLMVHMTSAWKMEWMAARGAVGIGQDLYNRNQRAKAYPDQAA